MVEIPILTGVLYSSSDPEEVPRRVAGRGEDLAPRRPAHLRCRFSQEMSISALGFHKNVHFRCSFVFYHTPLFGRSFFFQSECVPFFVAGVLRGDPEEVPRRVTPGEVLGPRWADRDHAGPARGVRSGAVSPLLPRHAFCFFFQGHASLFFRAVFTGRVTHLAGQAGSGTGTGTGTGDATDLRVRKSPDPARPVPARPVRNSRASRPVISPVFCFPITLVEVGVGERG